MRSHSSIFNNYTYTPIPPYSTSPTSPIYNFKNHQGFRCLDPLFDIQNLKIRLTVIMSSYNPHSLFWAMLVMLVSMMLLCSAWVKRRHPRLPHLLPPSQPCPPTCTPAAMMCRRTAALEATL